MAARIGRQIQIVDALAQAKAQGCEEKLSSGQVVTPWGNKQIRFLHNPATRGRFDITDYDDDEFMLESEIAAAERRLGITLR